jgi:hypothetical protein
MAGVVFTFVREDASDVEALAEAFDAAGYSISGSDRADDALNVVVWSRAAMRSTAFRTAADRALRSSRAIVASLVAQPHHRLVHSAPVADISAWDGDDEAGLDPLFNAVLDVMHPALINVIALPGPVYLDAEFTEARLQITGPVSAPESRARAAWETPIPTNLLRPVPEDAPEEPTLAKLGAPSPRRDFRRLGRQSNKRVYAALAFAVIAAIGGVGLAFSASAATSAPVSRVQHVVAVGQAETVGVSLSSASAEAIGLDDLTPVELQRLFEPGPQIGHAGLEPPSARSIRRAVYTPRISRSESVIVEAPPMPTPTAVALKERAPAQVTVAERGASGPMS